MTTVTDPMHYLRKERNLLLALTERDGKGLPDRPFTEAELIYRQELRDLPASSNPKWSPGDGLTNVTWPTKPE
tara:strand:- start:317 stop:535 length:219 start_codon:yes stop_codon:yes gene_type:complete